MFYCVCLWSGHHSEKIFFVHFVHHLFNDSQYQYFSLHCRKSLESNIGLVIKSLIFLCLNNGFLTERLARMFNLWKGSVADEQTVVVVVSQENVTNILSRKCQDNIRARLTWPVVSLIYHPTVGDFYSFLLLKEKLDWLIYWFRMRGILCWFCGTIKSFQNSRKAMVETTKITRQTSQHIKTDKSIHSL